eukprot:CAMPEP_0118938062 /NCGR_PEP_ID=MMETSP1169-20130426/24671_1 /TAXON_ID=36882 /ORGANISM="Pyramimonas obovata, Strain CCMP722" /LENGTH=154 /DNA_ID=CAMNT_0006881897 /DNA_START=114 /DNA_END=574 /DNA_ORIENTATION=+
MEQDNKWQAAKEKSWVQKNVRVGKFKSQLKNRLGLSPAGKKLEGPVDWRNYGVSQPTNLEVLRSASASVVETPPLARLSIGEYEKYWGSNEKPRSLTIPRVKQEEQPSSSDSVPPVTFPGRSGVAKTLFLERSPSTNNRVSLEELERRRSAGSP